MIYAGIGSRETPPSVLKLMEQVGAFMALQGHVLRSGGADGADLAFETGCNVHKGPKEIFIPWKGFNRSTSNLYDVPPEALEIASRFHPAWDKLKEPVRRLMARNVCQVLGQSLDSKSDLVICYTKNGTGAGGTGQALRIANAYKIPVFDFGSPEHQVNPMQQVLTFITAPTFSPLPSSAAKQAKSRPSQQMEFL